MSQQGAQMEGWLYIISSNCFGGKNSRRRYFVLEDNVLNCYKNVPTSTSKVPNRSAVIDSCICVTNNGRETMHQNALFTFTLCNASNLDDQLKLGAMSYEEASKWIHSLTNAAIKECSDQVANMVACSKRRWGHLRFNPSRWRSQTHSIDWTVSTSMYLDPMASVELATSPWTIFGCHNGLRLFKEAKKDNLSEKLWDDHQAMMAVGVVDASSEAIFQTIMSLGPSRSQWDFCFSHGNQVEQVNSHTDIIHKQLKGDWLPWGMRRRDLLLHRYWKRADNGTYVILYRSVSHKGCQPQSSYVRACIKSGGYVISPINQGKQSVVKHMLAMDWRIWKPYLFTSPEKYATMQMLGRVAAIREFFKAKFGSLGYNVSAGEARDIRIQQSPKEEIKEEIKSKSGKNEEKAQHSPTKIADVNGSLHQLHDAYEEKAQNSPTKTADVNGSLHQLHDAYEEYFDVPEQTDSNELEDQNHRKLSVAASFVKRWRLHVQKHNCMDLQQQTIQVKVPYIYGTTLPKDQTCNLPCSWTNSEPSTYFLRGKTFLHDQQKIKANGTLMQLVGVDWLKSEKRECNLGARPNSILQKYAVEGGGEFFFIINMQVPGSMAHNLVLYYAMEHPLESISLLERFVRGDDDFRNSRFKLIPYISKGSWIVKQSVGKKPSLIGRAMEINYFQGKNYLELGLNIGSSAVARGVMNLVLGYLNNLVIEMAFLIQGDTQEELPEVLLGTCRLNHLDASKAVSV